jgi:hypothetical protein
MKNNITNDIELFKQIVLKSKSIRQVLKFFNISSNSARYFTAFHDLVKLYDIDINHFIAYKRLIVPTDFDWGRVNSIKDAAEQLKLIEPEAKLCSTWYGKIKQYINNNNVDVSHFNYNGRYRNLNRRYNHDDIFIEDSMVSKQTLKARYSALRSDNIRCDMSDCIISDNWLGRQITLHLDHIDGNNRNNCLTNLRFLCPNCHSQTSTYAGRNLKLHSKKPEYKRKYVPKPKKQKTENIIPREKYKRPEQFTVDKDALQSLIMTNSMVEVAKLFKVSDNAIRKRCKKLGIDLSLSKNKRTSKI